MSKIAIELTPVGNNTYIVEYILNWNMKDDLIYDYNSDTILINKNSGAFEALIEKEKIVITAEEVDDLLGKPILYNEIETRTKKIRIPDLEKMGLL